ncbi:hypothetical protein EDD85DRAFT_1000530 [Armillaria nabsnona]|nr:hypothetical protein EDD85DRAFT_1000530 [Armillaria nabsnona]
MPKHSQKELIGACRARIDVPSHGSLYNRVHAIRQHSVRRQPACLGNRGNEYLSGLPLRRERDKDEFSDVTNENEYSDQAFLWVYPKPGYASRSLLINPRMLTYFWNDFLTAGHAYDFLAALSPSPAFKDTRYGKDTLVLKHNKDFVESGHIPILQHCEPNLFNSVVAADGDDVHVRSTMRKMTRAAQHQYELPDLGSCLPSLPSHRTASRNKTGAGGITALLPASRNPVRFYALLVHVSVMQWKSFMQMVEITDGQIAVLTIEKSYKFKKMMLTLFDVPVSGGWSRTNSELGPMSKHLLKPRSRTLILIFSYLFHFFERTIRSQTYFVTIIYLGISQLKDTLRAFGRVQIISPPKFFVLLARRQNSPSSNTNKPANPHATAHVFLKQVPCMSVPDQHENRDHNISVFPDNIYPLGVSVRSVDVIAMLICFALVVQPEVFPGSSIDHTDTIVLSKISVPFRILSARDGTLGCTDYT